MNLDILYGFVPEFRDIFVKRYEILDHICKNEIIGRRTLSGKLSLSERVVRDETYFLNECGYINISNSGMTITKEGKILLKTLKEIYRELNNLTEKGKYLTESLNVKNVIVVKGDSSIDEYSFSNLGSTAAEVISNTFCEGDYVGVTGGRTVYGIAREMKESKRNLNLTLIPARGSLGKSAEYQSNSIVATMAKKLKADYHILSLPDGIRSDALDLLLENEDVKESYEYIKKLNVLIFGIGRADTMSERRSLSGEKRQEIIGEGAVGEAFGHYFTVNGKEVHRQDSIGLTLEDFRRIPSVVGVAGGKDKAEAIIAISTLRDDMTLIIDESAAEEINRIKKIKK